MKRLPSLLLAAACLGTVSLNLRATDSWNVVTDASTLAVGDVVIIAAVESDFALSTEQKSNNRGATPIMKNGSSLVSPSADVQQLTLEEGITTGTFAFSTGSGYLHGAGLATQNYLRTMNTLDESGSWTISIADGVATLTVTVSDTDKQLRFYSSSSSQLFACYRSGQKDICLYRLESLPRLSPPSGLADSNVTTTGFTISWTGVSGAAGYAVALLDSTGTTTNDTVSCAPSETTATFTGLSPSTAYLVSVVALGNGTTSSDSPEATHPVTTATPAASDPPNVSLSTATLHIAPGESANTTVSADKPSVEYSVEAVAKGDGSDTPMDSTAYSFDEATGIFSFTPGALGRYEFTFTATDANGTSDPVVFTVLADSLSSPQNLTASTIGNSSFTASWDAVTGADNYDVALLAKATAFFDFEYASTGIGNAWATPVGDANLLSDRILWHAFENGARFYVDEALDGNDQRKGDHQIDGLSLTIRAGTGYPVTFGPFPNGVHAIAFDYVWAKESANSGHIRVYVDNECVGNSTSRPEPLVNMAPPSQTVQHFSCTFDTPFEGEHEVKILCTSSDVVIDNVAITSYGTQFPASQVSSNTIDFTGLTPATDHIFSVKATGYGYDANIESEPSVSDVVTTLGNHVPTLELSSTSATVHAGEPVTVTLIGADADGDDLSYIVWPGAYDDYLVGNVFTWTPTAIGTTVFEFGASDGVENSEPVSFTVTAELAEPVVTATVSDTSATLAWDSVVGATSYRVSAAGTSVKGTTVLAEAFDKFPGELTTGNSSTADETPDAYMTLPGWTLVKVFRGDNTGGSQQDLGISSSAVRVGTSSVVGSLTSPALDLSGNGGAFVVIFDARRFQAAAPRKTITVTAGETTETVTLNDAMTTHIVSFPAGTGTAATTIRIGGVSGDNRFFLDNLKIVSGMATATAVDAANLAVAGTTCEATGLMPFAFYTFTVTAVATVDGADVTASAHVAVETPEAPSATLILIH